MFRVQVEWKKRVNLESRGGLGLKVNAGFLTLFSKAQSGSGSSIALPKRGFEARIKSSVKFEMKGRRDRRLTSRKKKSQLELSGGLG